MYCIAFLLNGSNNKIKLIKYNYVADKNKSEEFKIYSFKFVADLNSDKINEIILQETAEFYTEYSIMQYKKNNYYTVLSTTVQNDIFKD